MTSTPSSPIQPRADMRHSGVALMMLVALLAFAGNSLLARAALVDRAIDAASFSSLRLASGALVLWLLVLRQDKPVRQAPVARGNEGWRQEGRGVWGAVWLFLYAVPFSFAYVQLDTGTGALILFGAVQLTMVTWGITTGERLDVASWAGLFAALGGLVYLMLPGAQAPDVFSASLMLLAGISWGLYSLRGKRVKSPLSDTARNFALSTPPALAVLLGVGLAETHGGLHVSGRGVLLALASGAITSGLGYAVWYRVLPRISSVLAATVQLTVPVLAASLGVLLISDPLTLRLVVAMLPILGGVAVVVMRRRARH